MGGIATDTFEHKTGTVYILIGATACVQIIALGYAEARARFFFRCNAAVVVWALLVVLAIAAEKASGKAFILFAGKTIVARTKGLAYRIARIKAQILHTRWIANIVPWAVVVIAAGACARGVNADPFGVIGFRIAVTGMVEPLQPFVADKIFSARIETVVITFTKVRFLKDIRQVRYAGAHRD